MVGKKQVTESKYIRPPSSEVGMENRQSTLDANARKPRPAYVPPVVKVMNEEEVLAKFQLTSAMMAWWAGATT